MSTHTPATPLHRLAAGDGGDTAPRSEFAAAGDGPTSMPAGRAGVHFRARRVPLLAAAALIGAPTLWLAGWSLMRIEGHNGPGWAWTTAHGVWVVAFLLFGAGAVCLHRLTAAPRLGARTASVTGLVLSAAGVLATLGQMGVDLYVGFAAVSKDDMGARYEPIMDVPGVDLVLFQLGPALLFAGLLVQIVAAAVARRVPIAVPLITAAAIVLIPAGRALPDAFRFVEGAGALVLCAAMIVLVRSHRPARP